MNEDKKEQSFIRQVAHGTVVVGCFLMIVLGIPLAGMYDWNFLSLTAFGLAFLVLYLVLYNKMKKQEQVD